MDKFNIVRIVGRLWCPELIPDIEKFLPVAIFKMAATMPHKFHIVWFQRPELIPDIKKFHEPNGEGNLVSRLVFFANTPPKHDISV
jgi:hypothetical protein